MHRWVTIITLFIFGSVCFGQDSVTTRLKATLPLIKDSFQLVDRLNRLAIVLYEQSTDSTFLYANRARAIALRLRYKRGIADANNNIGIFYDIKGEPELSLRYYNIANTLYKEINDSSNIIQTWMNIGVVYDMLGKKQNAANYFKSSFELGQHLSNDSIMSLVYSNYVLINSPTLSKDTTQLYLAKALFIARKYADERVGLQIDQLVANNQIESGNRDSGLYLLKQTVEKALQRNLNFLSLDMLLTLGDNYLSTSPQLALEFYGRALAITNSKKYGSYSKIILKKLHQFYIDKKQPDSAYAYANQLLAVYEEQDALAKNSSIDYIQYALTEQELESMTRLSASNTKTLILAIIVGVLAIIVAVVLWIGRRKARHTNNLLQVQFQQLESTSQALEASNESYARVLKVVAHDLRNPLANIFLLSKMTMEDSEVTGQPLEFAKLIHQISENCMLQIGDLMKADLGIGEESIEKTDVRMDSFLSEAVKLVGLKAREKKQTIVLKAQENIIVQADPQKLGRVINNLLVNALKFSPAEATISVSLQARENDIVIGVKDSGIGIPDNLASSVFDPFTKARRRGTAGEETFGLGLYISKKIVEAHHGKIWFETEVKKGTTFYIQIPIK